MTSTAIIRRSTTDVAIGRMLQKAGRKAFGNRRTLVHDYVQMTLIIIFLLGIANFALHRAVLESRHPKLGEVGWLSDRFGRRAMFGVEFMVLLAAMLMAANGWTFPVWGYLAYSLLNALAAWLILTRRF